jgi:hypothetical protein
MLGYRPDTETLAAARLGDQKARMQLVSDYFLQSPGERELEIAIDGLGSMEFGLFECLDYSADLFFSRLSISENIPHMRIPTNRVVRESELENKITEMNRLDEALYNHAEALFLERAARNLIDRGEIIDLGGSPWPYTGLSKLQDCSGHLVRWAGPRSKFSIAVPRDREKVTVRIAILDKYAPFDGKAVTIVCDCDARVTTHQQGEMIEKHISLCPQSYKSVRAARLEIIFPMAVSTSTMPVLPISSIYIE